MTTSLRAEGLSDAEPDTSAATSTVFVVDDDPAIRESLALLLGSNGFQVATYAEAEAFLQSYEPSQSGCLLLDIRMPGMSGLELQEELRAQRIRVPVIIITGHGDVPTAVQAMKTGAFDFIEKPCAGQALLDPVRRAIRLDAKTRRREKEDAEIAGRVAKLTPRELEVLRLLADGYAAKQVAAKLCRSCTTVDKHRGSLMKKLGVHDRVDLVRLAIRAGLVSA